MDTSEYKNEFISEAQDHMDTLNQGLLVLEKDASDMDNINKIFRAFHTLKGNSAAMGFMKFSELAHSLEDVLSKVRDKELEVRQEVMDLLFDGVDLLEEGLDLISQDNADALEVEGIIPELKNIIGAKEESFDIKIGEFAEFSDEDNKKLASLKKKKMNITRIIMVFDPKNFLKAGKASVVMRDVVDISDIIKSTPSSDDIKAGKFDSEVELVVASKKNKEDIKKITDAVSGVKKIFVLGLEEKYVPPGDINNAKQDDSSDNTKTPASTKGVVKQIQSVKVEMKKLDKLMNLVGELLISNIRLQNINKKHNLSELKTVLASVDRLILDLQDEVMGVRMVPIGNIINRFPRMVRDIANKQNKKVNFSIEGAEMEFDRTVLDEIGDPMVHLLRNSIDHGIETPEERMNVGKPQEGSVKVIARREKNHAIVEVVDDGAGIDSEKVKESCINKGVITAEEAEKMSIQEIQMLIFRAGVSTNKVVTEVSGRGVGMDVVESKIKQLGGHINLKSEVGKGSSVEMRLPLTVAIITALLVKAQDDIYAIPLSSVDETIDVSLSDIKTINNESVFILRNLEIPVLWLHELTGMSDYDVSQKLTVVIVNRNNEKIGIVVDTIESQQQILIKSLPGVVRGTKGVSGATILGDGNVALILDINTLFDN
ncbi:MAG: chemotaxis protein CheW [Candidatus Woesearchaeota archaeon]